MGNGHVFRCAIFPRAHQRTRGEMGGHLIELRVRGRMAVAWFENETNYNNTHAHRIWTEVETEKKEESWVLGYIKMVYGTVALDRSPMMCFTDRKHLSQNDASENICEMNAIQAWKWIKIYHNRSILISRFSLVLCCGFFLHVYWFTAVCMCEPEHRTVAAFCVWMSTRVWESFL